MFDTDTTTSKNFFFLNLKARQIHYNASYSKLTFLYIEHATKQPGHFQKSQAFQIQSEFKYISG